MKIKVLLYYIAIGLICFPFFLSAKQIDAPYFWMAEKHGKKVYLLGTEHFGVSLEDLACSAEITHRLITSDLVFVEHVYPKPIADLVQGFKEGKISKEEFEQELKKVIEGLTQEERQTLEQRIAVHYKMFYGKFEYNGTEGFGHLNTPTRDFLIDKGIDLEGNYADYAADIYMEIYKEVLSAFPKQLDYQVRTTAFSYDIPVQSLDNTAKITEDLENTTTEVSREFLETLVEDYVLKRNIEIIVVAPGNRDRYNSGSLQQSNFDPVFNEIMIENRHNVWIKKINDLLFSKENRHAFLAAGIGHFTSSYNSLTDMLQQDGYIIRHMAENCIFPTPWFGDSSQGIYLIP